MKRFIYYNIIHTRETLKHFPLNLTLRVRLKATACPVSGGKPNKQLKHRDVTQLTLICCSFRLTCAFSSVSSHTQHMTRAAQLDRQKRRAKRRNQTRGSGANPPGATLSSACVTVRAGWLLTECHFKQAKTAGKLTLLLLLPLLRWLDGRGLRICLTASQGSDRSLSCKYSLIKKNKKKPHGADATY